MDSVLVRKGLDFTRKRKKWIVVLGLIGFSSYGMYKVYHNPSVVRRRKRMMKLFEAMVSLAEVVSDSAETIDVVSKDLKEFLSSNSDEVPNSLKQLSKIVRSDEFVDSLSSISHALTVGILRGYKVESNGNEIQETGNSNFGDRVMDRLMSSAGTGFVSMIVGSFARNLVLGFYANGGSSSDVNHEMGSSVSPRWLSLITDDKCRALFADCINTFISTAVAVYLDKTMDVNLYNDLFSGLTNPKHQKKMKDILVSLCNGAVETLVKTSHQVLTSSKQNDPTTLGSNNSFLATDGVIKQTNGSLIDFPGSGWVSTVSSTLAVPSNRKFVLDVTGRVTFETVRSAIEVFLLKIMECLKTSSNAVRNEALEMGFEVVRFVGARSSVIRTICFAFFLHVLGNNRTLLPA